MQFRLQPRAKKYTTKGDYQQAAMLLRGARRTAVLTGAGISTGSGIPDFRSRGTGVWEFENPLEVASIWSFRQQPQRFYRWIRPLARLMQKATPNPAHIGLARLEQAGLLHTTITQNIDDLHQQAGAQRVLHIHGRADEALCLGCGLRAGGRGFWQQVLAAADEEAVPVCQACQGVMKPDVVLFGEELPADVLCAAQEAALECDLMLVIGTSLEVMPAADLPLLAKRAGARLVLCNLSHTLVDRRADVVLREDVTVSIPRLAALALDE